MSLSVASEDFWGCELKSTNVETTWIRPDTDGFEHKLFICQAVLGIEAKDGERNVVQATCVNEVEDKKYSHCITSLRMGLQESAPLSIGFTTSVTFKLVAGSGPVHLIGSRLTGVFDDSHMEMDSDLGDDDTSIEFEEADKENISKSKAQKKTVAQKDSDDDEDDENDDQSDADSDESDEDPEEDDSSDDVESEDIEDDDGIVEVPEPAPTPSKHKGVLKSKANIAQKNDKKVKFKIEDKTKGASVKNAKPQTLGDVKKVLSSLKTPLPKTQEKFSNFLKSNMRVNDPKVIADAWLWFSKTKK